MVQYKNKKKKFYCERWANMIIQFQWPEAKKCTYLRNSPWVPYFMRLKERFMGFFSLYLFFLFSIDEVIWVKKLNFSIFSKQVVLPIFCVYHSINWVTDMIWIYIGFFSENFHWDGEYKHLKMVDMITLIACL